MNKIINIILSGLLWRRYKFLIISLIIMIVAIVITGQVHQDYIDYAKTTEDKSNLGITFIFKWLAWLAYFLIFIFANHFYNKYKDKKEAKQNVKNSALGKLMSWKNSSKPNKTTNKVEADKQITENSSDPFDAIREKEKLRSYADLLIEKKDKE